ncbi:histone-lysine N-methyltransferase Clr4 [Aspergillus homomorphus CBS 101889]|uniref:SET domain-containing protein n=1 Tax=Aspergillus homomorphus (strain CBS 101889) TaxID=1450537 RepID=A0A395HSV6_ASPHC|nr:SET domain-containing protein [Aspergillus homomorphus CBS 101889]RAL10503.1 SET domain-containing protein [Aspergillus homomorphus CBS 101889]
MLIDLTLDSEPEELSKTTSTSATALSHRLAHRALNHVAQSVPAKRRNSEIREAPSARAHSSFAERSHVSEPEHRESEQRVFSQPELARPRSRRSVSSQENTANNNNYAVDRRYSSHHFRAVNNSHTTHSPTSVNSLNATPHSTAPEIIVRAPPTPRQAKHETSGSSSSSSTKNGYSSSVTPLHTALSEVYYPTDAHQKKAMKGAYPKAKKVQRSEIPLQIGKPGPLLTKPPNVRQQTRQTMKRKLAGIKGPKVTYDQNAEHLLADFIMNFEFVNTNPLRRGVVPVSEEFNAGCTCVGFCNPALCLCLSKEEGETNASIIPYQGAADDARMMVLRSEFLTRKAMIFECSDRCGCNQGCWNRVVQNGRTVRLDIFHTGDRGFGLRSPDRIRAGQFIDCYLGEIITTAAADLREANTSAHSASYLFSLDFLSGQYEDEDEDEYDDDDDDDNDDNDDDNEASKCKYVVDGRNFGGPTRFINHSCNPNCRMIPVSRNHADRDLYDLAFFAVRDIPPYTELTFDYNPGCEGVKDSKIDPNAVRCLCGEANCRGQLWPNQRKKGVK